MTVVGVAGLDITSRSKDIAKVLAEPQWAAAGLKVVRVQSYKPLSVPYIVGWLIIAAIIFTLYFGFIQLRGFRHAIHLVRGDYADPNDKGEVSHFQALTTALSGTVGLGNIAGVAVAVSIGGPGATFWMIMAGLLGMASKFCECTLGVKYRNEYADGSVSGGPMYYLSKGFSERFGEGNAAEFWQRSLLYSAFLARLVGAICFRPIRRIRFFVDRWRRAERARRQRLDHRRGDVGRSS